MSTKERVAWLVFFVILVPANAYAAWWGFRNDSVALSWAGVSCCVLAAIMACKVVKDMRR